MHDESRAALYQAPSLGLPHLDATANALQRCCNAINLLLRAIAEPCPTDTSRKLPWPRACCLTIRVLGRLGCGWVLTVEEKEGIVQTKHWHSASSLSAMVPHV